LKRSIRTDRCALLAAFLILTGLVFRLFFLGDSHFAFDEAFFYDTALQIARLKLFPVYGAFVTGASTRVPGGGFHLLMAIPLFFSRSPYGPLLLVMLLASLGQYLIFILFRRIFNCKAAIFALIITIFNPFFVFFADSIWNPDVLIFFGALWLFLVILTLDGRAWPAFWLGAILAFLPQIHLGTVHLGILTLALLIIKRPKLRWGFLVIGVLAGLATYIPYFWVDFHNNFANTKALLHAHPAGFRPVQALRAFVYLFIYPAGEATYFIAKGSWFTLKEWQFYPLGMRTYLYDVSNGHVWGYIVVAILVLGVILAVFAAIRWLVKGRNQDNSLFTLFWLNLVILPVEFWLARKEFFPHYTIMLLPLCLAPLSAMVANAGPRASKGLLIAGILLAMAQGITTRGWYVKEEQLVGLSTFMKAGEVVCFDPAPTVSFGIIAARNRVGDFPLKTLCRDYFQRPKIFSNRAKARYTIHPEWQKITIKNKWDLGTAILVKNK